MANELYVDNLSLSMTDTDLQKLFEAHGTVKSVHVIVNQRTGRPRGFGFVDMDNADEAQAAIDALNGQAVKGQRLKVNKARPGEEQFWLAPLEMANNFFG